MKGLAERMPLTVFSLALAGVSLMGLPPSGGFIGKWLLMHAVLGVNQWWWAPFLILGGLLTAGYMFKLLGPTFLDAPEDAPALRPFPRWLEAVPLALALISVGIGIRATDILDLVTLGSTFLNGGGVP
jgi:formate hydrogenlyase subunit 3/multisubunit Na+/H+ antiporter MnhD subunit